MKQPQNINTFQQLQWTSLKFKCNPPVSPLLMTEPIRNNQGVNSQQAFPKGEFKTPLIFQTEARETITIENIKYTKLKTIGKGSFGEVFLVMNDKGEKFALKIQSQIKQAEMEILQFFKKKVFKNLVNTLEVTYIEQKKQYFILMEYCEKSLFDLILQRYLDPNESRYIIKQLALGIQELHKLNIIHRDIKPENILIYEKQDPKYPMLIQKVYKLCDFGLSSTQTIATTIQLGTAHYMPPEQIRGQGYDKSVDIWAFGTVIFEIFSGKVMFMANSKDEIYQQILNITQKEIDAKIDQYLQRLVPDYVGLVKQMVQLYPKDRPTIEQVLLLFKSKGRKAQRNKNYKRKDEIKFTTPNKQEQQIAEPEQLQKKRSFTYHHSVKQL